MDKNQHGILKLSLQKRWVCGQSPEQRLWGPRFGSRLPVGLYATHLEKGFLISMLCHSAEWRNPLRTVHKVQLPMQQTGSSGTLRNQLRREQLRQPQCKYRKKGVLLDPMACQNQVQVLAFKMCLCSGSPSGNSTLQQNTTMGLQKSGRSLRAKVLSWRSEMLVQPLSCPAQTKVWQQLGRSFPFSLL